MKSRVEALCAAALSLAVAVPAGAVVINDPRPRPESWRSDVTAAGDAFHLVLEAGDLQQLVKGLEETFLEEPVTGRYDEPITEDQWFGTLGVHGIRYSFRIDGLDVRPADGYLAAAVRIKDLVVDVERVTLNASGSRYCESMPIRSGRGTIQAWAEAALTVEDRLVDLDLSRQDIALDDTNFQVGSPARCNAIWGLNWLVRLAVPWFADVIRDRVRESVAAVFADAARETVRSANDILRVSLTLPFDVAPAPAFYATATAWPERFVMTRERVGFVMGADLTFDPDLVPWQRSAAIDRWHERGLAAASYFGVSRGFLARVLAEANGKGLFRLTLTPEVSPVAAELLTPAMLRALLDDAAMRFPGDAAVALRSLGAEGTTLEVDPDGPGGLPILTLTLVGLKLVLLVDGVPYYELDLDLALSLVAGFSRETGELSLGMADLAVPRLEGRFASTVDPPPAADEAPDADTVAAVVEVLRAHLQDEAGRIFAAEVPGFAVGTRTLEFLGSSIRDDAVTVDARVVGP